MPSEYFEFKKFKVYQDKCAMKVGTDGVLLGGWSAPKGAVRILDVGSGTGLLALMMAQKTEATIDAVEIDADASNQAAQNFGRSNWSERLNSIHADVNIFTEEAQNVYDYVISNPPFFDQGQRSESGKRARARHNDTLTIKHLLQCATKLLKPNGSMGFILPYEMRLNLLRYLPDFGLWIQREAWVRPLPNQNYVRFLIELSFQMPDNYTLEEIVIEQGSRHDYSPSFKKYTDNYYL